MRGSRQNNVDMYLHQVCHKSPPAFPWWGYSRSSLRQQEPHTSSHGMWYTAAGGDLHLFPQVGIWLQHPVLTEVRMLTKGLHVGVKKSVLLQYPDKSIRATKVVFPPRRLNSYIFESRGLSYLFLVEISKSPNFLYRIIPSGITRSILVHSISPATWSARKIWQYIFQPSLHSF